MLKKEESVIIINNINIPNQIIDSIENNKLVVFAGAGVSMGHPTNLPNFNDLTSEIARGAYKKFDPINDTPERFLGELESDCVPVQKMASDELSKHDLQPNKYHQNIVDLFLKNDIRIITTNYDLMFEKICEKLTSPTKVYTNPAFPRGDNFNGIVHLHGDVKDFQNMVLTDRDFGRAYMVHGEASLFLSQLFSSDYTVLFIGYSYQDTVLRYFTRALPDLSGEKRYIFSTENEKSTHENLGLTPIFYESGNYENLYHTVRKLGEFSSRTSSLWSERILEISLTSNNEIDSEINEEIKYIFKKKYLLEQFLDKIGGEFWFNYLYKNNYFNFLFKEGDLSQSEELTMDWILNKFVKDSCEEIILMILKHNNELRGEFNRALLLAISKKTIEKVALKKILNILNYTENPHTIYQLIVKLVNFNDFDNEITNLFQRTLHFKYFFVRPDLRNEEYEYDVQIRIENDIVSEIWELIKEREINYKIIAETVTNELIDLEEKSIVGQVEHNFSPYSSFLDNSGYIDDNTHYIKFFVEILIKTNSINPNYIKNWIQNHISSDLSILRRVSIYLINYLDNIPDTEKLNLIKNKMGIFSIFEKEEIFSVISTVFPRLPLNRKNKFVKHIMNYNFENKNNIEEHDFKRTVNYSRFNMLVWLKRSDENNELVLSSIEEIRKVYPEFKERDYPDRNVGAIEGGFANQNIQVTPEYFLTNDIKDYFNKLLKYEGDGFEKADRNAYLRILSNAIGKEFNLGIELSKKLLDIKNYENDLWHYILQGFEKMSIDSGKFILIYNNISPKIIKNYPNDVTKILLEYSQYITVDEYNHLEDEICQLIDDILTYSKPFEGNDAINWVNRSLNTSYGEVARALVNFIKVLNENRDENDYYISEKLKKYLDDIMSNPEAGEAQTVLYTYFNYLNLIDNKWVNNKLIPHFTSKDEEKFNISWQGYLTNRSFIIETNKKLEESFSFAIKNLKNISDTQYKQQFVRMYTFMCIYVVEDPLLTYIPNLYKYAAEFIQVFYNQLITIIKTKKENKKKQIWSKWLNKFIDNRINNIPSAYKIYEASYILFILLEYNFLYEDAKKIINNMKKEIEYPIKYLYKIKNTNINQQNIDIVQLLLAFYLSSILKDEDNMIDSQSKQIVEEIILNMLAKDYKLNSELIEQSNSLNIDFTLD